MSQVLWSDLFRKQEQPVPVQEAPARLEPTRAVIDRYTPTNITGIANHGLTWDVSPDWSEVISAAALEAVTTLLSKVNATRFWVVTQDDWTNIGAVIDAMSVRQAQHHGGFAIVLGKVLLDMFVKGDTTAAFKRAGAAMRNVTPMVFMSGRLFGGFSLLPVEGGKNYPCFVKAEFRVRQGFLRELARNTSVALAELEAEIKQCEREFSKGVK